MDKKIVVPEMFLYSCNSCFVYILMTSSGFGIIFSNINWAADLTVNRTYLAKNTKTLAEHRADNYIKLFKSLNQVCVHTVYTI